MSVHRHVPLHVRLALARRWHRRPAKGWLANLGPGLITGASDDDPSGIATYSQAGAQFGYTMCWVMLFCFPLMAAIQEISARIGRVTGMGIAGNIRLHYPAWLLRAIVLLLVANIINLGADLGAMAAALQLLIGGPVHLFVVSFAVFCVGLEVFSRYERYIAILKWVSFVLLAYVAVALVVDVPWRLVIWDTLVPNFSLNTDYVVTVVIIMLLAMRPDVIRLFTLPRPLWAVGWLCIAAMTVAVAIMFAT